MTRNVQILIFGLVFVYFVIAVAWGIVDRKVRGTIFGLVLGYSLIAVVRIFQLQDYLRDHFHFFITGLAVFVVAVSIIAVRKLKNIRKNMPKSTIEYLNHEGDN